jgi:phosphotransferase system HPr-like phosphotransfer protein
MKEYNIMLNSIDKVKSFVSMINGFNIQADLHAGSYAIDAQSILGIFTLNLTKPLTLKLRSIHPEKDLSEFESKLEHYII